MVKSELNQEEYALLVGFGVGLSWGLCLINNKEVLINIWKKCLEQER